VSNVSGLPPVYVRGNVGDYGGFGGISTRGGHMVARSDCLNDMMRLFGHHTSAISPSGATNAFTAAAAAFRGGGGGGGGGGAGFPADPSVAAARYGGSVDGGELLPTSTFVAG
jgi:hypothetical protein